VKRKKEPEKGVGQLEVIGHAVEGYRNRKTIPIKGNKLHFNVILGQAQKTTQGGINGDGRYLYHQKKERINGSGSMSVPHTASVNRGLNTLIIEKRIIRGFLQKQ